MMYDTALVTEFQLLGMPQHEIGLNHKMTIALKIYYKSDD